jgi:hypothetical protein
VFAGIFISQLVLDGYVSPHPVTAREQICQRYICDLTLSGLECEGIRVIRDLVESLDSNLRFAKSLLICAPHTHWGYKTIVESFNRYDAVFLQGPTTADELRPISFVFTKDGPAPFEWMDETVEVDPVELAEVYAFIARVNAALVTQVGKHFPIPLGISIDHRFKQSIFEERLFGYVEGYHLEHKGRAVVRPVLESVVQPEDRYPDQVQVTWSCFPNSYYPSLELLQSEREALLDLEAVLRSMSPSEAVEFISGLQSMLQEQVG